MEWIRLNDIDNEAFALTHPLPLPTQRSGFQT